MYWSMEKWFRKNRLVTLWISEQRPIGKAKKMNRYEKCLCDCGNETWAIRYSLSTKSRWLQSCGCLRREIWEINRNAVQIAVQKRPKKPQKIIRINEGAWLGDCDEYKIYCWIKKRCNDSKNRAYKRYWERWIKCLRKSFQEFYNDIWKRPTKKHSIDRIDNDGNYCKENCRWANPKEQCQNKRTNVRYERKGKMLTIRQIIEQENISISYKTVWQRLKTNRKLEKALFTDPCLYHNK